MRFESSGTSGFRGGSLFSLVFLEIVVFFHIYGPLSEREKGDVGQDRFYQRDLGRALMLVQGF